MPIRLVVVLDHHLRYFIGLEGNTFTFILYLILLLIVQHWNPRPGVEGVVIHEVWLFGPNTRARHRNPTIRMLHLGPHF